MILDRMLSHLSDSMSVDGDIIEFGIFKGETYKHLVVSAMKHNKIAYGIDSFRGLSEPTPVDWNENNTLSYPKGKFMSTPQEVEHAIKKFIPNPSNFQIISGFVPHVFELIPDTTFSFALVDLVHYEPTKEALEYLWERMSYGSTIYFDNYFPNKKRLCSLAINEFLEEHADEIIPSRQMVINGNRESQLAVKCIRQSIRPVNYKVKTQVRPLTVALVLKTGGEYNHNHVNNLVRAIKNNLTIDHRIVCLTDNPTNFDTRYIDKIIPFKHNWPKWWGKIEMFRPDLFGDEQVLYFDLDTFIVNNIDEIGNFSGDFSALRDFYHLYSIGSGVMSWHGEKMHHVYNGFVSKSTYIMNNYQQGDQKWIDENKPSVEFMQDLFPNKVISYKVHCNNHNGVNVPNKASVICFHGQPRPHNVTDVELKKYWNP